MPTELPAELAARANRALDSLHAFVYFIPEADEEWTRVGLRPGRMGYFASRSAPLGPVPAEVVAATFYNFNPTLVARYIPRAWTLATPADVLVARLEVADRGLRRLIGDEVPHAPAVHELAELAREATVDLPVAGRALFGGHAALEWPTEPHLVMWHAITLLREFRGDGHVAVLLAAGLSGLDALITHTATGRGFTVAAARATRGWSDDEWTAAEQQLRADGLIDEHGLTEQGEHLRDTVEARTDELSAAPWLRLGLERTNRLIELGRALSRQLIAGGAFPAETFASRR
jgi:hypothetical protein